MVFVSQGKKSLFALYTRHNEKLNMQYYQQTLQQLLRCDHVGGRLRRLNHDTLMLSDYPSWGTHIEHMVRKQFPNVTVRLRTSSRSLSGFEVDFEFASYRTQVYFLGKFKIESLSFWH